MRLQIFLSLFFFSFSAQAVRHQMIDTLGTSPKGQYVALEEYGYLENKDSFYVVIKVLNVWKKKYVGEPVKVEVPAKKGDLKEARQQAKLLVQDRLIKLKISG